MSKENKYPSRTADQFVVRFPSGLRDRIAEEAKKNNRSMNAEIISILQMHYSDLDRFEYAVDNKDSDDKMGAFVEEFSQVMRSSMRELMTKHDVLIEFAKKNLENKKP